MVFDVNVFIDAVVGRDSTFPLITEVPPTTGNAAADAFSLAYDAETFSLFTSPHIVSNSARVLGLKGIEKETSAGVAELLLEIVQLSGGSIVEPDRTVFDVADYEDNLILDLVKAVDAHLLITSDKDLLQLNPWNGRLVMTPRDFVGYAVRLKARY